MIQTLTCRRGRPLLRAAVVLVALMGLSSARAATLDGISFPDQATVNGKTLILNGLGLRTATIFKVKVYVIGLYLENKSHDAEAVVESRQSKRIVMHFVHHVSAGQLRDGWTEGFEKNTKDIASIKGEIATFNASMRDLKEGDRISMDFSGNKVEIWINGTRVDVVESKAFQQALLKIWLGPNPPEASLQQELLGR